MKYQTQKNPDKNMPTIFDAFNNFQKNAASTFQKGGQAIKALRSQPLSFDTDKIVKVARNVVQTAQKSAETYTNNVVKAAQSIKQPILQGTGRIVQMAQSTIQHAEQAIKDTKTEVKAQTADVVRVARDVMNIPAQNIKHLGKAIMGVSKVGQKIIQPGADILMSSAKPWGEAIGTGSLKPVKEKFAENAKKIFPVKGESEEVARKKMENLVWNFVGPAGAIKNVEKKAIPKALQFLSEKAKTISKEKLTQMFNEGLKAQNLTTKDTAQNTLNLMKKSGITIDDFYKPTKPIISKSPLAQEAKKYKSAEEFVKAVRSGQKVDIPINKISGLEPKPAPFPTAKRAIIEPVDIIITDQGDFILEAGNHRYHQAIFNGDKTIPAKIRIEKGAESQLTDLWNQANRPKQAEGSILGITKKAEGEVPPLGGKPPSISPEIPPEKVLPPADQLRNLKEGSYIKRVKELYPQISDKLDGIYQVRSTNELAQKAKNLIKDNPDAAEHIALNGSDDVAVVTASELINHYENSSAMAKSQVEKNFFDDRAISISNDITQKLTSAGQTVRAAWVLGKQTPSGQLRFAQREIQKYNLKIEKSFTGKMGLRKQIPDLTKIESQKILDDWRNIQKMPQGFEKLKEVKNFKENIAKRIPTTTLKKIATVWKAGLLTGLKTTGLNLSSNTVKAVIEIEKDIPGAVVDNIVSLFTGKRALPFTIKGTFSGAKEGIVKGWRYLKTGIDERYGVNIDYKPVNFGKGPVAKFLNSYTGGIFKLLGAEDQPFYYSAYTRSLYSQAKAEAMNRGLKGTVAKEFVQDLVHKNPTQEILEIANKEAKDAIFNNKTILGKLGRAIQKTGEGTAMEGIGEFPVPFINVPSAIAMDVINYSPIGIANTIIRNIGKGNFNQREFSQGMGRGLTGTAILGIGVLLFNQNKIALDRPTSDSERQQWQIQGKIPNSIFIKGKWRTAAALGPSGIILLIGAHIQKSVSETGSFIKGMQQASFGTLKSFTEQTFLQNINQLTAAISDPERYGPNWYKNFIASFVPTLSKDIAVSLDIKQRQTDTATEAIKARIPFLRESLKPKIDVLGKEISREGGAIRSLIDPTRPSSEKHSPVIDELTRLYDSKYLATPAAFGEEPKYDILTEKEQITLEKRAGNLFTQKVEGLIKLPAYTAATDQEKSDTIKNFATQSRLRARVEILNILMHPLTNNDDKLKELAKLKKSGFLTNQVYKEWLKLTQ